MAASQTRIFVPSNELDDWPETLAGTVFRPLIEEFDKSLSWFWFSRYGSPADDSVDCDISQIPQEYKMPLNPGGQPSHRSMRFRFSIPDDQQKAFELRGMELINQNGYRVSDFREYDSVADTGNNRFLGTENRFQGRPERRAELAVKYYMAVSLLVLDALVGPDEQRRFKLETNDDLQQNPRASTFQSFLHMFCNITNVPTDVYVYQKTDLSLIGYGTFIYPPSSPPAGWDSVLVYPIRF